MASQRRYRRSAGVGWVVSVTMTLCVVVVGEVVLDEEMAELAQMVRDNCAEESGVDISLVEKINKGAEVAATPDPKLKCYIKCTMETAGMLDEGEVDLDAVVEMLPDSIRDQVKDGIIACKTVKGSDDCETAYLTQICWQNSNRALYFLI